MKKLENNNCLLPNLSEEVNELNRLLLDVKWENVDFDSEVFDGGLCADNKLLNSKQKKLLQVVLQNIPEWERLLACKQHFIHDYYLDIHTLSVIKKVREFEKFGSLDDYQKLLLMYSALLHDIEKTENEIDPEHPTKGAKKSSAILYRLGFNEDFINSVYLLIKHHQILGLLASKRVSFTPQEIIEIFKDPGLLDLHAMLSVADIKSVKKNESFMKQDMEKILDEIVGNIREIINPNDGLAKNEL